VRILRHRSRRDHALRPGPVLRASELPTTEVQNDRRYSASAMRPLASVRHRDALQTI